MMPNAQEQCFRRIEDYDFIPGLDLYSLDSDGDGLSDLQEIQFFNTSANNPILTEMERRTLKRWKQ
jgi:hypothetical protein